MGTVAHPIEGFEHGRLLDDLAFEFIFTWKIHQHDPK
jgi:hypothetical protein